ncbi:transcriptional regulatory protein FixJ [Thalassobaculum fulvum]|jgi:two-component system response regulator FixJ|uniref:Transcriptional regulatory protein FixJ n=1 Tax=Thalassobaculum fulvum TaxID=1633335 RepID=A0A918XTL2_9PROT|nr:response regulator [Thalassobaculum fulvum]GHD55100.1 transcriptional regulatory protein FixJ [Thalassobaculum fulvum]
MSTVALVDDDPGVLDAVGQLLASRGYAVERYASAAEFLSAPAAGGCVVSDLRMPGMNGLALVAALQEAHDPRPVILLTAHGDVELAVRALKQGAFDFIEKPFEEERLLSAVAQAVEVGQATVVRLTELTDLRQRYASLSVRQREVMWLVVAGCANKEISARLGISIRTVETYRAWVFEKMGAKTLAELVRHGILLKEALDTQEEP